MLAESSTVRIFFIARSHWNEIQLEYEVQNHFHPGGPHPG
jgi:hypothetical protein